MRNVHVGSTSTVENSKKSKVLELEITVCYALSTSISSD